MTDVYMDINEAFKGMPDWTLCLGSGTRGVDKGWSIDSGVDTYLRFKTHKKPKEGDGGARFSINLNNMWNFRHVLKFEVVDINGNYLQTSSGKDYTGACDVGIGEPAYTETTEGKSYHGSPTLDYDTEYAVVLRHTGAPGGSQTLSPILTKWYGPVRPEGDEAPDPAQSIDITIEGVDYIATPK